MSIKEIYNSSFTLAPLQESAYEMKMKFTDEQKNVLSEKSFIFAQQETALEGEIVDVYSQNGKCSENVLSHLFQNSDESGIKKVLSLPLPTGPTVFVLDLQDPISHYQESHRQ